MIPDQPQQNLGSLQFQYDAEEELPADGWDLSLKWATLVMTEGLQLFRWPSGMFVNLPIEHGGSFHSYVNV